MKKLITIVTVVIVLIGIGYLYVIDFNRQAPGLYFQFLLYRLEEAMDIRNNSIRAMDKEDNQKITSLYDGFSAYSRNAIKSLEKIEGYNGDTRVRDKIIQLIRLYVRIAKSQADLRKLVNEPDETFAMESFEVLKRISEKNREDLERMNEELIQLQMELLSGNQTEVTKKSPQVTSESSAAKN